MGGASQKGSPISRNRHLVTDHVLLITGTDFEGLKKVGNRLWKVRTVTNDLGFLTFCCTEQSRWFNKLLLKSLKSATL